MLDNRKSKTRDLYSRYTEYKLQLTTITSISISLPHCNQLKMLTMEWQSLAYKDMKAV